MGEVDSYDILLTWSTWIRLTLLLCTLGRRLDGKVPTIDNSTDATTVLQFKNLLNSWWTTKDRRGYHLLLLLHNQGIGCTHRQSII